MDERSQYLDQVAAGLPFEAAEQQEILHELAAHLDDSSAALQANGLDAESADRAALVRLGSPDRLAVALTKARRTPRRLWAAVGAGAWATVTALVSGYIYGLLLVTISAVGFIFASLAIRSLAGLGGTAASWDSTTNTAITLLTLTVAAAATGVVVPGTVAARAGYRQDVVRRLSTPVGGVLWLAVSLFVWSGPLSWAGVLVLLSLPICFTVGALFGTGTRFPPRRGWWRPLILFAIGAATLIAATGLQVRGSDPSASFDLSPIGAPAPDTIAGAQLGGSTWSLGGTMSISTVIADRGLLAGWRDLRVEAWRGGAQDGIPLDTGGPFVVAPVAFGPPGVDGGATWSSSTPWPDAAVELSGTLRIDRTPGVTWAWLSLTGVAPDGVRYTLVEPQPQQTAFNGTVWDWFQGIAAGR